MYFIDRNILSVWNRLRRPMHNIMCGTNIFWWSTKKVWQVYTNALYREKLCNHCIQVWQWKKSDDSEKKVRQVYTNALHREKLCNHCIQVWRWLLVTKTDSRSLTFRSHFWLYAVFGCWESFLCHYCMVVDYILEINLMKHMVLFASNGPV